MKGSYITPMGKSGWPQRLQVAPSFAHQSDQVGLGDTEFHVLTGGLLTPVHDRFGVVGKPVVPLVRGTTRRPCSASLRGWWWN